MPDAGQHTQAPKQQAPPNGGGAEQAEKDAKEMSEAFAKELAKGITAAEPAGDPEVMVAFTLGWQMSELYKPGSWRGRDAKPDQVGAVHLPHRGLAGIVGPQ